MKALVDRIPVIEQLTEIVGNRRSSARSRIRPAAYGLLLDAYSPVWTTRIGVGDDLARLLIAASGIQATAEPSTAAARYGGAEIRTQEKRARCSRSFALRICGGDSSTVRC